MENSILQWRNFLLLALIISLVAIISNTKDSFAQDNTAYKNYTHPIYGLKIQYPPTWEVIDDIGNGTETNNILRLIAPAPFNSSDYTFIDFYVDELPPDGVSVGQYMNNVIAGHENISSSYNTGFKMVYSNPENVSLAGFPAFQIIYTTGGPEYAKITKWMETGIITGNLGYRIEYDGSLKEYATHYDAAKKIINSLQINPVP